MKYGTYNMHSVSDNVYTIWIFRALKFKISHLESLKIEFGVPSKSQKFKFLQNSNKRHDIWYILSTY